MKAYKEDRFLPGRQTAYLIYEYFRVTGANDSVENYADLFTVLLRNDDIQEFDSKWDEILLSMTQIPSDDILENLYKLRIRESEKLKTVLELYNMEILQKKEVSSRIYESRILKPETEILKQAPWSRIKGQNSVNKEIVGNGKPTGSVLKETICSFRHDKDKRAKSTQPNPSPRFSSQQSVNNASRTQKSQRKESQW